MEVVSKLIDNDEALVNQFDSEAKRDAGTSATTTNLGSKLRKRPSEVLAANGRRQSTFNVDELNAVLNSPYTFHEGATHTVCEFQQFKRVFRTPENPKRSRSDGDRSSSRRYSNNLHDNRRGRGDNDRHDDRRCDNLQPEDRRGERDLPPHWRQATPTAHTSRPRGRLT
jgi:hypothetical protein